MTRPVDDIERALLELQALGRSTVAGYRGRSEHAAATVHELIGGFDAVLATAARLVSRAESTVDVILASDVGPSLTAHAGTGELLAQAGGAARLRVLCSMRTFAPHLVPACEFGPAAVEVRIGRLRALEAVVVDGRVALARPDAGCPGQAVVVRSRPVVRAVGDLFADVWRGSQLPPKPLDLGCPDRTAFAGQVLRMLYTGHTDEAAARELALSVRTYRRYVAAIVAAVGARSRFQAGVRAAAAGLLPPPH